MTTTPTIIYPAIGAEIDLFFIRLSGHGLGNCFYTYFHAVALAESLGAKVIMPPWISIKLGPLLRGERTKRTYWKMFRPAPTEIHGIKKLLTLMRHLPTSKRVICNDASAYSIAQGHLIIVRSNHFTFKGLHSHRASVRQRLLDIIKNRIPADHNWGNGDFIAIHIRLGGDFARVADEAILATSKANLVVPLAWYVGIARSLKMQFPQRRIYIFSDGKIDELKPVLDLGAELYSSGSDVLDLLKMASASLLVGSNSTFSRWAAFLGDMPSIWLKKGIQEEKPSGDQTPIAYVAINSDGNILWD